MGGSAKAARSMERVREKAHSWWYGAGGVKDQILRLAGMGSGIKL